MEILIGLETLEPPAGTVRLVDARDPASGDQDSGIAFIGWLGLLRALDDLVGSQGGRAAGRQAVTRAKPSGESSRGGHVGSAARRRL